MFEKIHDDLSDVRRVRDYIRNGEQGDFVLNENNDRKIVRKSSKEDKLPTCYCFEGENLVGTTYGMSAIYWLFGFDEMVSRKPEFWY